MSLVITLTQLNRPWAGKEYVENFYLLWAEKITPESLWLAESRLFYCKFLVCTAVQINVCFCDFLSQWVIVRKPSNIIEDLHHFWYLKMCSNCKRIFKYPSSHSHSFDYLYFFEFFTVNTGLNNLQVTVSQETLNDVLNFLIDCIKTCKKWTLLNILRALGSALYENGSLCGQVYIPCCHSSVIRYFVIPSNETKIIVFKSL